MKTPKILAIAVALAFLASTASGGTLATGPVTAAGFGGDVRCRVVNISKKPRQVRVRTYSGFGTLLADSGDTTIDQLEYASSSAAFAAGPGIYCIVDVDGGKKSVRGEMCIYSNLDSGRAGFTCVSAR